MRVFYLGFLVFSLSNLKAQNYHFYHYSLREGVPQSQVTALASNADGELLLGTWGGGIATYDGYGFNKSQAQTSNDFVNVIKIFGNDVWIGTQFGLTNFKNKVSKNYTNADMLPAQSVYDIIVHKDSLILATSNGLIVKKGNRFYPFPVKIGKNKLVRTLCKVGDKLYCAGDYSVFCIQNGKYKEVCPINYCTDIQMFGSKIVLSSYAQGIWLVDQNGSRKIENTGVFIGYDLALVNGQLWLSTEKHGVQKLDKNLNLILPLTYEQGLPRKAIRTIMQDKVGNIWFGTSGDGLYQLASQKVQFLSRADGLNGDAVYCISIDTAGAILMGAGNGGLDIYKEGKVSHYGQSEGFVDVKCRSILQFKNSTYIGTEGKGLWKFDGMKFESINQKSNVKIGNWVRTLAILDSNTLLVGTAGGGYSVLKNDTVQQTYRLKNGLANDRVSDFLILSDATYYVICESGINYFDGRQLSTISLFKNKNDTQNIVSILFWKNKMHWASNGGGVTKEGGESWKTLSHNIYLFEKLSNEILLIGHEKGIELHSKKGIEYYSSLNGLPSSEICRHAYFYDPKTNRLFVGTINGLGIINLGVAEQLKPIQSVRLESLELFLVPFCKISKDTNIVLNYKQNHLSFRFSAVSLVKNQSLKFRYKLVGQDDIWVDAGQDFRVVYSNLQPGNYAFVLQYSYDSKVWKSAENKVQVCIEKPFFAQWWFVLLAILFCFCLLALVFWLRLRNIKRKSEIHKLNSKMSDLERKALNLQMNPHFLFNSINAIKGLIAENETKEARHQLTQFAQLMRGILDNSRKEVISLAEELRTVENYVNLERSARSLEFEYKVHFDPAIDLEEIKIPPLIVQPFVENAILHGVLILEGLKKIELSVQIQGNYLLCEIKDNGLGFQQHTQSKHDSIATKLVEERLSLLDNKRLKQYLIKENSRFDNKVIGAKVSLYIKLQY